MAVNLKRLVYFDSFMDPIANAIIGRRDDIDLVRLVYDTPEADNWAEISQAHGYQVQARGELQEPFFPDAKLLARCPNLLAVSSTGAGYDMIDVNACDAAGVIVVNQSGTNWEPVAEHALGMMLSLTKKIALSERAMKRRPISTAAPMPATICATRPWASSVSAISAGVSPNSAACCSTTRCSPTTRI